ncbi:unnamed protein product [Heligmosomoides polygyrus]|uniref:Endo/exonuclease/phosphatase domain-containing protein n=1 Tax=Heligmosomoides polygyrus TaxID=6339 RepID=A0A183GFV5_HELPZ|nr:unnamed protein product [Heligmosomoides polygyrus]
MENRERTSTQAAASGAADAPALMSRNRGAGVKSNTGYTTNMFTPKREVTVASWNVRTAYQVGQKEIIARELVRYKVSIAAQSELRLIGSGQMKIGVPHGNAQVMLFYSGGDRHTEGVGFALDEKATDCVLAFHPISSRLAVLMLAGTVRTYIFSVYAPTEISPDDAKDDFYSNLQAAIDLVPKTDVILLAGDFNAHVGRNRVGWEEVLGRYGIGEVSDNGVRLLTFAAKEFFERMYNHATPGDPQVAPPLVLIPEAIASDAAPTREEVAEAIRLLRNNKAAGIDGVMTEMLKAGGDVLINRLHALLKLIWRTEKIPMAWKQAIVIPVLKKVTDVTAKTILEQVCFLSKERCSQECSKRGCRNNGNVSPERNKPASVREEAAVIRFLLFGR